MKMSPLDAFLFLIRKLLTLAVMPLSIVSMLLLLSLWLKKRAPVAAALVLLYIASIPITADRFMRLLESAYPRLTVENCPQADAIVVLGGIIRAVHEDHRSIDWSETIDRFEQGVFLLQAKRAEALVLTGATVGWVENGLTEGDLMRKAAANYGADPTNIEVVYEVATTADEARQVAAHARKKGWNHLILVTSAFHMKRAVMLFEREDLQITPFPVDYRTVTDYEWTLLDFVPQGKGLNDFELAMKEVYGLLFYSLFP